MKRTRGFTLIELMITVAILSILASVALPSYQRYVDRSYRTQAQVLLQQMAQQLERRYSQTYRYGTDVSDKAPGDVVPPLSVDGMSGKMADRYSITVTISGSGRDFSLKATPKGAQADDVCGTLALVRDGGTTASGPGTGCWG
ncbi:MULTISPECIES: type IV pilin protein [Halomonas]|uniref:Type IV pilus assembly protein PilE n=1 Tax=Halomonas ventosae TaxID=229007 RepID=A0A4V6PS24_9GAMM|nr:type IV pilin protein [Halomonas ventosae]TDO10529.1 type IV pilus assembly protein PilE [Halomonas ventosae]